MKNIILALSTVLFLLASCSKKKEDVKPVVVSPPSGKTDTTTYRLPKAIVQYSAGTENYLNEVAEAINASGITVTQVSENSVILCRGNEKVLLESNNGELYVSNPVTENGRITKNPLKVPGASKGGFYGITIYINAGNYKEIIRWFTDTSNNPFKVLFGQETYDILFGAKPGNNYVFNPTLNVSKLPKGAFETTGNISAKKEGALSGAQIGSKVSVTGESPGMFGFYMDEQAYVESGAYSLLITTKLTDKDYVMADGVVYPGSKNPKNTSSFIFMLGLGKGQNNPPMSGILIGFAAAKKATSAMMFIGVFSGLKVK